MRAMNSPSLLRRVVVVVAAALALAGGAVALAKCGPVVRPDGGRGLLPIGAHAPDLTAVDQDGRTHRLSDERGHLVLVYFYPRDGTPGCTKEACALRDAWGRFRAAGITVLGVSSDDRGSHASFAREHGLPFAILADPDHVWSKAFGVGTTLGMDARVSFVLAADGTVKKVYPDVDPAAHAEEVLRDVAPPP